MFYKKTKSPEIGDIVICTVKKVLPHSVFVDLDEYGKEAMIHISEIAPGRIRNIRDYVKEKKKPPEVIISGVLKLESDYPDGIESIKKSLSQVKNNDIKITYLSAQ